MSVSADTLAGRLSSEGHELIQRVYYEDTDFSGRVYHARYLQFLERGRSDYLRLIGVGHAQLFGAGLAFVVRHMDIDFRNAAGIDDVLRVQTRQQALGGASMVLEQLILREELPIVSALVKIAIVDRQGRARRLPDDIRAALSMPASTTSP